VVIDLSAASFRVQAFQDGWNAVPGDNAVLGDVRLTSTLLATDRLKIACQCPGLIAEIPGLLLGRRRPAQGRGGAGQCR
jgi:hypothetical protein